MERNAGILGKAVIDKSQLTWEPSEVVVEPKPSLPELALPKSTALPAPPLPAKNQDRLQAEDNLDPPKPIRRPYRPAEVRGEGRSSQARRAVTIAFAIRPAGGGDLDAGRGVRDLEAQVALSRACVSSVPPSALGAAVCKRGLSFRFLMR